MPATIKVKDVAFLFGALFLVLSIPVASQTISKEFFRQAIKDHYEAHQYEIIKEFIELLSIPNVSADKNNIRRNAEFISSLMEKRKISTRIFETPGNPVVYGERMASKAKHTLLFYVHYDGQPVDPSKWTDSHPFQPVVRPGKLDPGSTKPNPIPLDSVKGSVEPDWRIYARSTSDDKAPIIAFLAVLDALDEANISLTNNLKFIFEGEEEAGSPNLEIFLSSKKDLLNADVLFMCDGSVYYSGNPTLFFGVRGIVDIEITVFGPNRDLHSGRFGNWAPNPALKLAKLLASMKDRGGRVVIDDFYNSCVPLSDIEIDALRRIPSFDEAQKKSYGFMLTEGLSEQNRLLAIQQPSLNINRLQSGWEGEQSRTIIPSKAVASLDIRLVEGNDPKDMLAKVKRHIIKQGYHVVLKDPDPELRSTFPNIAKVVQSHPGYRACRTSMDLRISRKICEALMYFSEKALTVIPSVGGSLPFYQFNDSLGIPVIGVAIANHDNNQHQEDENIRIGNLWSGIETFAALFLLD